MISVILRAQVALCLLVGASISAAVPLDDSPLGMTCYFYSAAARLEWQRKGGDWVDRSAMVYGSDHYSTNSIRRVSGQQEVKWDATELVREQLREGSQAAGIFLRAEKNDSGGIVNFFTREHPDPSVRPRLVLEWSNGSVVTLMPQADTYFSCPNHRSYGSEPILKAGGGHHAVLLFPLANPKSQTLKSATLILVSDKQFGKGALVALFRPSLPSSVSAPSEQGIAASFGQDRNIRSHPDVIYSADFESGFKSDLWKGFDKARRLDLTAADAGNRFEPLQGRALSVTIAKGFNSGLNAHLRFQDLADEPDEAYFRYYLRFGESWNPTVDGGKMPGFSGTYGRGGWGMRKSDGKNGWSARGAFFRQAGAQGAAGNLRGLGSYLYHANMGGTSGDTLGWSLGPSGFLEKNRWYSVEQHVRLNTPGKSDGVLRAWIDGQLVFERSNIRYRDTSDLKVESVWFNIYHGGVQPAPADMTLFIDNLVIARKYIGPMNRAK